MALVVLVGCIARLGLAALAALSEELGSHHGLWTLLGLCSRLILREVGCVALGAVIIHI